MPGRDENSREIIRARGDTEYIVYMLAWNSMGHAWNGRQAEAADGFMALAEGFRPVSGDLSHQGTPLTEPNAAGTVFLTAALCELALRRQINPGLYSTAYEQLVAAAPEPAGIHWRA